MNVLFVIPPYRTTDRLVAQLYPMPYGPVLLATVLQQAGHSVRVRDCLVGDSGEGVTQPTRVPAPRSFKCGPHPAYLHYGLPMFHALNWLEESIEWADVVCLAMGQCNIWETGALIAEAVKQAGKPLVIGGPLVTTDTPFAMALTGATVAVQGEGELVIEQAVRAALAGEHGIGAGTQMNPEAIPTPDWSLVPLAAYPRFNGRQRGVLAVSRGCPWECGFCSVHTIMGREYRFAGRHKIRAELLNLFDAGCRYICFLDDNLFLNEKRVATILGVIEQLAEEVPGFNRCRFYMEEGLEVRVAAKPGVVKRIARWFDNIGIGLETLNTSARVSAKKPYGPKALAKAVQNINDAGVVARAFYIIGFPEDTVDSVCQNLIEFGRMRLAVRANNLKVYPGTQLHQQLLKRGVIKHDYDWRLSSWHTPKAGALDMGQIRKLKTVLGAIGHMAEMYGLALFADEWGIIRQQLTDKGVAIQVGSHTMVITGKFFRPTPYRHAAMLLGLRCGWAGANAKVTKNDDKTTTIVATRKEWPADEVQAGLARALGTKVLTMELGIV